MATRNFQSDDFKLTTMKNKKYHNVGTVSKSNIKIIETESKPIPRIYIQDLEFSWVGTGTLINKVAG